MSKIQAFNPLDKVSLAKSIKAELLARTAYSLGDLDNIAGAGVYAIYYAGPFLAYEAMALENEGGAHNRPIYVGKAIPKGGRKGGLRVETSATGKALADRLRQHASSISEASNLTVNDFSVRHLVVDDIWIPLGENVLIETFKPVWNVALDGFGNKDPGKRRALQYKSPWDVVHPGRKFAEKLTDPPASADSLVRRIRDYLAGKELAKLPKVLEEQQEQARADAAEAADEV